MQTFFRKRRFVRYFVVQEKEKLQELQEPQQPQQPQEPREPQQQALAHLSSTWEALKRKDSEAVERIAEEASAKDRTGWFKWTRWDEHLQAYPDWKLLSYAIRLPGNDEPELKQVVVAVEELVEQAVHGLSTLSLDTLRWLRSAKASEPDVQPLSRLQNAQSQQRAARLWAQLLCYCLRLVAAILVNILHSYSVMR